MGEFNESTPKEQDESTVFFTLTLKVELRGDREVTIGRQNRRKIYHPNKAVTFFAPDCTSANKHLPTISKKEVDISMNSLFWLDGATRNNSEAGRLSIIDTAVWRPSD